MGTMNDLLINDASDLFPQSVLPITLQGPVDLEGFRRAARALLAQNILPEQVSWHAIGTPARQKRLLLPRIRERARQPYHRRPAGECTNPSSEQ